MPRNYQSPAARCPYYRGEDSGTGVMIFCSGVCGAKSLRLLYPDGTASMDQKRRCCRGEWESCPLAQLMLQRDIEAE